MKRILLIVIGLAFLLSGVMLVNSAQAQDDKKPQTLKDAQEAEKPEKDEKADKEEKQPSKKDDIKWQETRSGLKWVDLKVGEGKQATNGDQVLVHYHLWLADKDGGKAKSVQSSRDPNPYTGKVEPFSFKVGDQRLVKGWNEGMIGMQPGGLRRLWLPPELGWGANAMGDDIPANSEVIFEIELLEIQ